jgi:hypothetical protein
MNAKDKKELLENPEAFVASMQEKHAAELAAKDEAHAAELAAKDEAHAAELAAKGEAHAAELAAKGEAHAAEMKELKAESSKSAAKLEKLTNEIPGTAKVGGKVFKFKTGFKFFILKGKKIAAVDALKDADLMTELVEIGFGGIEEVEK